MLRSTPAANPRGRSSRIVPPPSRAPPDSEENVAASWATDAISAYRDSTQNPSPPGVCAVGGWNQTGVSRSEEHTSELQSRGHLVCRLLLEKKKKKKKKQQNTKKNKEREKKK